MEEAKIPANHKLVQEGKAKILYAIPTGEEKQSAPVFYNPVQEFNRDLSVLIINTHAKLRKVEEKSDKKDEFVVLEALAATGLRSIRYLKEVPAITTMIINDLDPVAINTAKQNLQYNNIDFSRTQIEVSDAIVLMQKLCASVKLCDVIDLDPYGTAIEFLDSALRALKEDGIFQYLLIHRFIMCHIYRRSSIMRGFSERSLLLQIWWMVTEKTWHARGWDKDFIAVYQQYCCKV